MFDLLKRMINSLKNKWILNILIANSSPNNSKLLSIDRIVESSGHHHLLELENINIKNDEAQTKDK